MINLADQAPRADSPGADCDWILPSNVTPPHAPLRQALLDP